ncbi:MAG: hypothetical protein U0L97_04145 [Candidatus Saccharimonadaceae bacterium]|nr:hypothetical protein [Candidatus Saccharimonadaceae bacterium]
MNQDPSNMMSNSLPAAQGANYTAVNTSSLDRPMQQAAPINAVPKKHKTKLIVGIIAAIIILIGGGVAAAVILLNIKDPVAAAMTKMVSGGAPDKIAISGNIKVTANDPGALISEIKVSLNSKFREWSLINNSSATITATIRNVGNVEIKLDEVYASGDDLFIKLEGLTNAIEDSGLSYLLDAAKRLNEMEDCGDDAACQGSNPSLLQCIGGEECDESNIVNAGIESLITSGQIVLDEGTIAMISSIIDAAEVIDGEWLKISSSDLKSFAGFVLPTDDTSCVVDLASAIYTNRHSTADLYNKYPFVKSDDNNITISSVQYPVHKVGIDSKNFADFVNSIRSTAILDRIYSCLNLENDALLEDGDVAGILEGSPDMYVEVDNDDIFTRLYFSAKIEEGVVTADLNFTYPSSISVPEPPEYIDLSDVEQDISTNIYEAETVEDTESEPSKIDK